MRIRLNQAVREITGQANRADNVTVETTNRAGDSTGRTSFAPGDRVITLRNEKSLRITGSNEKAKMDNGQCWTVLATKQIAGSPHALLTLESDAGKRIQFSTEEYNSISHAWALTVHQSEGVTCTGLVALPADASMVDIHSWYVMMSRSRSADHTHIVMPESLLDDVEAASGLAENGSLSDRERLKSFLKNAERERYDHLSIKFKTKAEVEAQVQTQTEVKPVAQPTTQTEAPTHRQGRSIRR
jgi:ATP-dependent exoDNAse (exonuclease V) alpha subunit